MKERIFTPREMIIPLVIDSMLKDYSVQRTYIRFKICFPISNASDSLYLYVVLLLWHRRSGMDYFVYWPLPASERTKIISSVV